MTNWLQRPTTQHVLTSLGAVVAGVVLPSYFPKEWTMATATAGAVGGVGGNLISNFLAKFFDRREADPTRPDINGDLLKLVGNAIAKEIADCSRDDTLSIDKTERSRLFALANKAAGAFEQLMHDEELPDIAPPDVKQLLTDAARDQTLPPVGKVEDWRRLVARLASHWNVELNINTMVLVAQRLHTHLWESIRSELKKDFSADGRAYAALHLSFMSDVLATLHTLVQLPREQTQLTQVLLEELRAYKANYADPKVHTLLATLAQEESERTTEFRQRFDSLDTRLDTQFGRVLDELATMERFAQHRHQVTQTHRQWTLAVLTLFLLCSVIGFLFYLHKEKTKEEAIRVYLRVLDHMSAGDNFERRNNLEEAKREYQKALEIYKQLGQLGNQAYALHKIAYVTLRRDQIDEAERLYLEVLTIYKQLDQLENQAIALTNLGLIAKRKGNIMKARRLLTKAQDLYSQLGKSVDQKLVQKWLDELPPG